MRQASQQRDRWCRRVHHTEGHRARPRTGRRVSRWQLWQQGQRWHGTHTHVPGKGEGDPCEGDAKGAPPAASEGEEHNAINQTGTSGCGGVKGGGHHCRGGVICIQEKVWSHEDKLTEGSRPVSASGDIVIGDGDSAAVLHNHDVAASPPVCDWKPPVLTLRLAAGAGVVMKPGHAMFTDRLAVPPVPACEWEGQEASPHVKPRLTAFKFPLGLEDREFVSQTGADGRGSEARRWPPACTRQQHLHRNSAPVRPLVRVRERGHCHCSSCVVVVHSCHLRVVSNLQIPASKPESSTGSEVTSSPLLQLRTILGMSLSPVAPHQGEEQVWEHSQFSVCFPSGCSLSMPRMAVALSGHLPRAI